MFSCESCEISKNVFFTENYRATASGKTWLKWTLRTLHLGSGLSTQSNLYFRGFQGTKLLNGCLVIWPNKKMLIIFPGFFKIRRQLMYAVIDLENLKKFPIKYKTVGFSGFPS